MGTIKRMEADCEKDNERSSVVSLLLCRTAQEPFLPFLLLNNIRKILHDPSNPPIYFRMVKLPTIYLYFYVLDHRKPKRLYNKRINTFFKSKIHLKIILTNCIAAQNKGKVCKYLELLKPFEFYKHC